MAGLGETPIVEHVLGHRIGDDGGSKTGHDVGCGAADRGHGGRRAGSIRAAGRGSDWNIDGDNRKRRAKRCRRGPWRHGGDRHVEPELLGPKP